MSNDEELAPETVAEAKVSEETPPMDNDDDDDEEEETTPDSFQCFVCLDPIYKPVVLECGHISCFWCVHKAMSGIQESRCAICRQPYQYFPSICPLLHHLLRKMKPVAYRRREKEVLESEKKLDCFSPQNVEHLTTKTLNAEPTENDCDANYREKLSGNEVIVADVLCSGCKELLFRPAALNCGHVYCESCMVGLLGENIKCQICESLHPGGLPKICLDLDHFLEERFPQEYAQRRDSCLPRQIKYQNIGPLPTDTASKKPYNRFQGSILLEALPNAHVGVGCDTCGMYPIIGKRYKCKDCKEAIGFDLCEACYNTSSKRPGRFNQQHTPDHKFVLDDSQKLCNIIKFRHEDHAGNDADSDDVQNGDSASGTQC